VVLIFVLLSGVVPIERGIASIDLAVSSGLGSEWIPVCGWGNETIVDSDDASPTSSVYRGIQRVYIRLGLMNSLGGMAGCDGWVGSPESNRLTDRSSHSVTLTQHALPKPRVYATRPANQLYRNPQNSSFNPTSLASPPSPPPGRTTPKHLGCDRKELVILYRWQTQAVHPSIHGRYILSLPPCRPFSVGAR